MKNDNFKQCCGENSTLNIGDTIYCTMCDQVSEIVGGEVEWTDGTATRFDYRGMLTEDVTVAKDTARELAAKVGQTAFAVVLAIVAAVLIATPWLSE